MTTAATASLVGSLRKYRLLEAAQLEEVDSLQARFPDPIALARELLQRGWLSAYQANQLLQGRGQELLLGSYVLLERLGQGGMGTVFKARNWKYGRIVALKVIRKERLDNPEAIRRFEREVRAVAALAHPNIVHAHDADQVAGTHLLVMDYVEGTDLARLVKKNGPLPAAQACEYIRQTALGLQHAHERGLVHRDIKPGNLLVTADGAVVKILDLGLARLDQPPIDGGRSTLVTQEGTVVGTPDYLAPEQARQSHTADIRADLYSLGCVFYCLLTGRPPFPGGSIMDKILKHQSQQPKPLEQMRPDVPPRVAAIVRKLMAKKPEERYQAPMEVATALAADDLLNGQAEEERTIAEGDRGSAVRSPSADTFASPFAGLIPREAVEQPSPPQRSRETQQRERLLYGLAGSLVLIGVVVVSVLLWRSSARQNPYVEKEGSSRADRPPPTTPLSLEEKWFNWAISLPANKQLAAVVDRLKERNPGFDYKFTHKIEDGVVTEFGFHSQVITDIAPLRALRGLKRLTCHGTWGGGRLQDLAPLRELKLTYLHVAGNRKLSDLSPFQDMPLTCLECFVTDVSDLSPLKGKKIEILHVWGTPLPDLSLVRAMPLKELTCDFRPERDTELLRSIKTLEKINGKPLNVFWADLPAEQEVAVVVKKLRELNPGFDGKETHKVENNVVTELSFATSAVTNLTPVRALTGLKRLTCAGGAGGILADVSPLKGMQLTHLDISANPVSDLTPLQGMPLTSLHIALTRVSSFSALKGMLLTSLTYYSTPVSDISLLKAMPLKEVVCSYKPERDAEVLFAIKSLETIDGKPADVFWKEEEAKKREKKP